MQRSAERDVERNASPHLFTPHSDLPSFASDAPPTGRHRAWQWLDTAIRFDQSEQSSRHATRSAERGVSATSISRPRMPFRPVSSNQSRHVLRAHRRFTALVYATFRSPTTPHRSRVTRHLPADIGHGNGWILLSDSDQSEESNGWILLSDSDQSERSSHAR